MNYYNPSHINYFQEGFRMTTVPGMKPVAPGKGPDVTLPQEKEPHWLSPEEGLRIGNLDANSYIPYLNYVPKSPTPKNEQEALMLKIQQLGFATHELKLFLNNYPNDRTALDLYLRYRENLKQVTSEYENKFRPISLGSAPLNKLPWQWAATDWPWEKE